MSEPKKTSLSFAGEYIIDECTIETRDGVSLAIKSQIVSIVVYEDLFSPFMSGNLFIRDTLDLPNLFGRSGMNILKLKISTPSFPERSAINGYFHVYKQYERIVTKQREQLYALGFISLEAVPDQKNISESFSGHPEQLAAKIVREKLQSKKLVNTTPSTNTVKYVSNFWTATKNLSYLAENAKRSEGVANYMFYENRDGFNFKNISDIAAEPLFQSFSQNDYLTSERSSVDPQPVYRDPVLDYKKIIDFHVDTSYDFERDRLAGTVKTTMFVPDPILKRYTKLKYSMLGDKAPKLNSRLPYSDAVVGLSEGNNVSHTRFYNAFDRGDPSNLTYLQNRIAQMRRYQSTKIEIEVLGRVDYTVGKKVYVEIPLTRQISKDDTDILDKVYSGNYIIGAISHRFDSDKHMCTMELIKDSTLLK